MKYEQAIKEYERAIELNPNDADSHAGLGAIMNFMGQRGKAIQALETAYHFNPHMRPNSYMQLGIAYYLQEQYKDSIGILEQGLIWYPDDVFIHIPLAAAYAMAGRHQDIERTVTTIKRLNPFFEIGNYGLAFSVPSDREKITTGLRKAGL
jgi:tetratricopeptide (TPR) repeat protein